MFSTPDRRQVLREGVPVHLTPKAYVLLAALVEASPRALSKDELQQRLWPATFVDEANLSVLVSELRAALNDDARQAQYVRTVHGFGYAFAAESSGMATFGSRHRQWRKRMVASLAAGPDQARGPRTHRRPRRRGQHLDRCRLGLATACATRFEDESGMLEDLGSKNGTWVNGVQVSDVTPDRKMATKSGSDPSVPGCGAPLPRIPPMTVGPR